MNNNAAAINAPAGASEKKQSSNKAGVAAGLGAAGVALGVGGAYVASELNEVYDFFTGEESTEENTEGAVEEPVTAQAPQTTEAAQQPQVTVDVQQPVVEQPVVEQPVVQQPAQPAVEQPATTTGQTTVTSGEVEPVDPSLPAEEPVIAVAEVDPNDIDAGDLLHYDSVGVLTTDDGSEMLAAQAHLDNGEQVVLVDVDNDTLFDVMTTTDGEIITDMDGDPLLVNVSLDDVEMQLNDGTDYLAATDIPNDPSLPDPMQDMLG